MVCILETLGRDWGSRFYVWRYVTLLGWSCLIICLQHPAVIMFLRDAMEIVKIYDYKPAWIARYEGMIIGLGSLYGVGHWGCEGIA